MRATATLAPPGRDLHTKPRFKKGRGAARHDGEEVAHRTSTIQGHSNNPRDGMSDEKHLGRFILTGAS